MIEHPQPPSTRALLAACSGFAIVLIDVSVVNVALDALRSAFHTDVRGLQWVVNAYTLVFAASLLLAGTLSDRVGAKRLYLIGLMLFTAASLGCAVAATLWALIGWRVIQGFGAALLVPTSLALLRQLYTDPTLRSRAVGWWSAGGGIALAAGPVLGGVLMAYGGWRSVFLINLPVGLLSVWLTVGNVLDEAGQPGRKLDLPGQLTGALALVMLTLALTEAGHEGWGSPLTLAAFAVCLLAGGLFFHLEAGNPDAMLPPALLRNRVVRCTMAIGLIANLVFYGMVFTFSLYFQAQWHWTPDPADDGRADGDEPAGRSPGHALAWSHPGRHGAGYFRLRVRADAGGAGRAILPAVDPADAAGRRGNSAGDTDDHPCDARSGTGNPCRNRFRNPQCGTPDGGRDGRCVTWRRGKRAVCHGLHAGRLRAAVAVGDAGRFHWSETAPAQ